MSAVGASVSFAFLSPTAAGVVARSPMERQARAAGARFEVRDGWNVAVGYAAESRGRVTFADCSHIRKYELQGDLDRKSTRLNSSHANISYAVFCLKKK